MFRLSVLNVVTDFHKACDHQKLFNELNFAMDDITFFHSATLYGGNVLTNPICKFDVTNGYDSILNKKYDEYMINLKFKGYLNFSVLIRQNRLRISTNIPTDIQDSNDIRDVMNNFIHMIIKLLNDNLNIDASFEYKIILINGVLYCEHNLINNPCTVQFLKDRQIWPIITLPDFSGNRRRKGVIKFYINGTKKHGTIMINKKSFHFMGFVKTEDIVKHMNILLFKL